MAVTLNFYIPRKVIEFLADKKQKLVTFFTGKEPVEIVEDKTLRIKETIQPPVRVDYNKWMTDVYTEIKGKPSKAKTYLSIEEEKKHMEKEIKAKRSN